jgi:predicted O-methyltransferase YrrM
MFWDISGRIQRQMDYLEAIDRRDRQDGTPRSHRLRQVVPETGKFLALVAASALPGQWIEIGSSGGYSGLWISLACRMRQQKLITFEISADKVRLAEETFTAAGVKDFVTVIQGDAHQLLEGYSDISFCFLDAEKEEYLKFYELVIPRMVAGGWFIADNIINHGEVLKSFVEIVLNDQRVDALVLSHGKGLLLCRNL